MEITKYIDNYQQNHVYFVNIACKFIMVTLLIVPRVASQYFFVRTVDFCMCPFSNLWCVYNSLY